MDLNHDFTITNCTELGIFIKSKITRSLKYTKNTWKKRFRKITCNKETDVKPGKIDINTLHILTTQVSLLLLYI
jgi:hypothetical protein